LRFDDMIATVLAQAEANPSAAAAKWRQLVDLLAQRRGVGSSPEATAAIAAAPQSPPMSAAPPRKASPAAAFRRKRSPSSPKTAPPSLPR
jgi:hypothetical protein